MLLWIDLHRGSQFNSDEVADALELNQQTRSCLADPNERACFDDYGRYIHLPTYAPTRTMRASYTRSNAPSARTGWSPLTIARFPSSMSSPRVYLARARAVASGRLPGISASRGVGAS
jgi:hypothetical protein